MSERSSFVSEYIYNNNDYNILIEHLKKQENYKHFAISESCIIEYNGVKCIIPLISGKIGGLTPNHEYMILEEELFGIITESDIKFIIICESGTIYKTIKYANGNVTTNIIESGI